MHMYGLAAGAAHTSDVRHDLQDRVCARWQVGRSNGQSLVA